MSALQSSTLTFGSINDPGTLPSAAHALAKNPAFSNVQSVAITLLFSENTAKIVVEQTVSNTPKPDTSKACSFIAKMMIEDWERMNKPKITITHKGLNDEQFVSFRAFLAIEKIVVNQWFKEVSDEKGRPWRTAISGSDVSVKFS